MSSYRDVPAVVRSIWCAFLLLFTLTSLDARWTLDGTGGRMGKSYATHSTSNGATPSSGYFSLGVLYAITSDSTAPKCHYQRFEGRPPHTRPPHNKNTHTRVRACIYSVYVRESGFNRHRRRTLSCTVQFGGLISRHKTLSPRRSICGLVQFGQRRTILALATTAVVYHQPSTTTSSQVPEIGDLRDRGSCLGR